MIYLTKYSEEDGIVAVAEAVLGLSYSCDELVSKLVSSCLTLSLWTACVFDDSILIFSYPMFIVWLFSLWIRLEEISLLFFCSWVTYVSFDYFGIEVLFSFFINPVLSSCIYSSHFNYP